CRVDGPSNILRGQIVEHPHYASLGVYSNSGEMRGEQWRGDTNGRATTCEDRLIGSSEVHGVGGDLLQCDILLWNALNHHLVLPQLHIGSGCFQHLGGNGEKLQTSLTSSGEHSHSHRVGSFAASRE